MSFPKRLYNAAKNESVIVTCAEERLIYPYAEGWIQCSMDFVPESSVGKSSEPVGEKPSEPEQPKKEDPVPHKTEHQAKAPAKKPFLRRGSSKA